MAGSRPIVRRIDHMPFVVDDPGKAFSVLSEQLSLPILERSSITVGNIDLFFFKLMGESPKPRKPIVGIAFEPEPIDEAVAELDRRGIAHDYRVDDWESFKEIWCILLEFFGSRLVDYAFIAEFQYPDGTTHAGVREQRRSMLSASSGGVLGLESAPSRRTRPSRGGRDSSILLSRQNPACGTLATVPACASWSTSATRSSA